ncbi:MAG: thiolase C-terminal domain-containing protein [Candidatus Helarchaeota archaeon]
MRKVSIIGAGMTKFGRHTRRSFADLGAEACQNAIDSANVDIKEIHAAYYGTTGGVGAMHQTMRNIGILGLPITRVENGCATGSTCLREAYITIASGLFDIVIAMGIEKMYGASMGEVTGSQVAILLDTKATDLDAKLMSFGAVSLPGIFALMANRHKYEFGTTYEQIAQVAVKNHNNGAKNPYAQHQQERTLEEIMDPKTPKNKLVSTPLTKLQCCPITDGAAAIVLASADIAKKYCDTPVSIEASYQVSSAGEYPTDDWVSFEQTRRCAKGAYKMAGIEPKDINLAEVHDCFSVAEIIHYEDLGFCKKGEGGKMIDEGETEINARITANPCGGLIARGHPLGATGIAMTTEIFWQFQGSAGKRQVDNLEYALQQNMGWPAAGLSQLIHIFKRQ